MRTRLTLASTAALAAALLSGCVQPEPQPPTAPETPPPSASSGPSSPSAEAESRCDVPGYEETSSLVQGPEAEWSYIGSIAVPGAGDVGPGELTGDGVRTCFAHTAAGAVTMAYNGLAQSSDSALAQPWAEYAITGPGRAEVVAGVVPPAEAYRAALSGFRVLAYDGDSARIDVAFQVSADGSSSFASAIFELVWEDGDWRVYAESVDAPGVSTESIGSLSGYTAWSE